MKQSNTYVKRLRELTLNQVVCDLVKEKIADTSASKKISKESYREKLAALTAMGIPITRQALHARVCRAYRTRSLQPVEDIIRNKSLPSSEVASLPLPSAAPRREEGDDADNAEGDPVPAPRRGRADWPPEDAKKMKDCISSIAFDYATELTARKAEKKRVRKGYLADLIKRKQDLFGLITPIPQGTIRTRVNRKYKIPGPNLQLKKPISGHWL